ncbi:MAG TPA: transglutaminase domain-containing protein [Bacteroidia bacterium]|jgi:transglutaminase/protease-like cytokinesis protein 3|nr:transglutaminase domain-containing protein [Bacteroidia bacterium]
MQRHAIFILLFFCSVKLPAQSKRSYIDSVVASMKIEDSDDPEDIALDVTRPFKTDSEKVRALYFWVTENIEYDFKQLKNGSPVFYGDPDVYYDFMITRTLRKKKGVCGQYAMLFAELCRYARIPCKVIIGWGLTSLYYPFDLLLGNESNHGWNAVRINGKWYLLDLTWASGSVNSRLTKFIKQRNDLYYLTPPEEFAIRHHPEEPRWQLLEKPYSMQGFVKNAREKLNEGKYAGL